MRALGVRVKSGYAITVLAEGNVRAWQITKRTHVPLTSATGDYARSPFHPLIELDSAAGAAVSARAVATVKSEARMHLAALLASLGAVDAAGVVGGSLVDPDTLGNSHMRVHAQEGRLFREVVNDALDHAGVRHHTLRDKDAYRELAQRLGISEATLKNDVNAKGRGLIKPWRADEKLATVGALSAFAMAIGSRAG